MLRRQISNIVSNPFAGDRPIWLTLGGAVPVALGTMTYQYLTIAGNDYGLSDMLALGLSLGLLASVVLMGFLASVWAVSAVVRRQARKLAQRIAMPRPTPEPGLSA
ncbi:MAG: hypothetical protein IT445_19130 [Phycisphaeraceae bacterium]|nr:hypothetical protein [Phycisphaeraceae bacterium]